MTDRWDDWDKRYKEWRTVTVLVALITGCAFATVLIAIAVLGGGMACS